MSKKLKTAVLGLMILLPIVSGAETIKPKANGVVRDLRQDLREKRMEIATSTAAKIEKRDEKREILVRIAGIKLQNIIDRFNATLSRMDNITNKIISRIEKVKTAGGDTTNAEKYIADAQKHFGEAKTSLTTLMNATSTAKELMADSNTSTSTAIRTGIKKVKDVAMTIEMHIKEGHQSLNNALKSLRGMSSTNASTTPKSN